jgi:hypothetical protein
VRRRLAQEDGIALVVALGFIVVLTILVSSMISYTTASSQSAGVSRNRASAQTLAEAGIAQAASIINMATNASSPTLLGCSTSAANSSNSAAPCTDMWVDGPEGRAYFHGMYAQTGNTGTWTITAYGSVPNPTGAANLTKALTATISLKGGGQTNNISVWNYVYSTAPIVAGVCQVDIQGNNVIVKVPLFVTGNLCLNAGNASIQEDIANGGQPVDVRVLGQLVYGDKNAAVGTVANPITSGLVSGGCTTTVGGATHTCSPATENWFVKQTDSPITASAPTVDFPGWYQNASPGPKSPCDTSLTSAPILAASTFDNDTTMNGTSPSFDLTGVSSYNCVTSTGTLSWNVSTKILTIKGTIFFDGPIAASNSGAMYHGKATIYVNGTFTMGLNNASLRAGCPGSPAAANHQCAFTSTAKEWDPNADNLLITSNKPSGTAVSFSQNNIQYQGGLLCPAGSTADFSGNNIIYEGAIICGRFNFGQNMVLLPLPSITNLPPGAPLPPNAPATISPPVITSG